LEDDASSRILWLHGPAGAGKSAVAQTLCQDLVAEGRLGASFFFKRGDPSRGEGMKLFPTIAYHLACLLPEFRTAIVNQMENDPGVFNKSPLIQLEKLLIEPSRAIDLARTLVIVIDGLDECAGEKRQLEIVRSIGQGLLVPQLPLRFLIASRPEAHISDLFREPHLKGLHRKFNIHPSFNDIHTYLRDEFARIYRDHGTMVDVPGPWPSQKVVKHLIQKSSGYFIYASTVIKFIDDLDFRPTDRLEIIMGIAEPHHESPLSTLDQLYTQILGVVPGHSQLLRILSVLATQLVLPIFQIEQLLGLKPGDVWLTFRRVHSVINVPSQSTDEDILIVHHASFLDFLNDQTRSSAFYTGISSVHHQNLVEDILKAFSYTNDDRSLNAVGHVAW
jgi:hypothetical protein